MLGFFDFSKLKFFLVTQILTFSVYCIKSWMWVGGGEGLCVYVRVWEVIRIVDSIFLIDFILFSLLLLLNLFNWLQCHLKSYHMTCRFFFLKSLCDDFRISQSARALIFQTYWIIADNMYFLRLFKLKEDTKKNLKLTLKAIKKIK